MAAGPATSKTQNLKGALIGFGFISSKGHAPAYQQRSDVEIVAIADGCEARRVVAAQMFPEARIYADGFELIKTEKGVVDFVDIATPPVDHAPLAAAALDGGFHVLCEKPLTVTTDEAKSLLKLAQKNQRTLFPCHNYKHAPVVKAIREIIASGKIGEVRSINLQTFRNTHAKGVTEWNTNWRRDKAISGGGIAMDHGSHSFYLAFEWMRSFPVAVTAKMATVNSQFNTEDNFDCVLTFPTGLAHFSLSWTAGVRKVIYVIHGTKGAITVDDDDLQLAVMRKTDGPDVAQGAVEWDVEKRSISSHWMDASHVSWFHSLFDRFKVAVENGETLSQEIVEAAMCVETITSAYQSAVRSSQEISISRPMFDKFLTEDKSTAIQSSAARSATSEQAEVGAI